MTDTLAAIDIGTSSVHLVVARVGESDRFEVVAREKEMVRLSASAGDMKRLRPHAIDRGIAALARFRQIAGILRLAIGLDRTHAGLVESVVCRRDDDELRIEVARRADADLTLDLYSANNRKGLLEEVLGTKVDVVAAAAA